MSQLVIDSGVSVKWFVQETDSAPARLILGEYALNRIEFLAPELIYAEFGNVIWKKHQFQGLPLADAEDAIVDFKDINFIVTPISAVFDDAFKIAVKHKRTFYDSLYLALSVRENCQFVTADEKLYNAVSADFPNVVWLPNWT